MTYEIYRYIFIVAAVLCGVLFVVSVLLFILLNIPKIISDLSGATARKAIKDIREQNEKTGDKSHQVSVVNRDRGKLTDKISKSGRIVQNTQPQLGTGVLTSKISTAQLVEDDSSMTTVINEPAGETSVLMGVSTQAGETSVLSENAELPDTDVPGTTVLNNISSETTVLDTAAQNTGFVVEYEITYIHTNEIIEAEVV